MDALKRTEKIIRENAFEQKKKKPRSKFNEQLGPGSAPPPPPPQGIQRTPEVCFELANRQWLFNWAIIAHAQILIHSSSLKFEPNEDSTLSHRPT